MRKSMAEGMIESFETVEVSMIEIASGPVYYQKSSVGAVYVVSEGPVVGRCLMSCFVLGTRTRFKEAFSHERVKEVINATASDGAQRDSCKVGETMGEAS
jgi:hypothetical protein